MKNQSIIYTNRDSSATIRNFLSQLESVQRRRSNERRSVVEAKKQRRAKCCAVSPGEQQMRGWRVIPLHREFVTRVSPWFMVISSLRETFPAIVSPPSILALVTSPSFSNLVSIHLVGWKSWFREIGHIHFSSWMKKCKNQRDRRSILGV